MESKNLGWSKKWASAFSKSCNTSEVDSYIQKEECFHNDGSYSYQWIVVLQKRRLTNGK